MTDRNTDIQQKKAKLNAVEDGLAQFVLNDGSSNPDENTFFWPIAQLPENIELGDTVNVSLELTNKEERRQEVQKRKQQELKEAEMRKLLEELVN